METVYKFERYRGKTKMAQGATITKAVSLDDAIRRAKDLFDNDPQDTFRLVKVIKDNK